MALKTSAYDYDLPPELIAQVPLAQRDSSRLMVVDRVRGSIAHHVFGDLPELLQPGDLLVHNESRVIPARLFARKPTGGRVEVLLLRPRTDEVWETLVRGRGVRPGMKLDLLDGPEDAPSGARITVLEEGERGMRVVSFERSALELAHEVGETPLPPYIHEQLDDPERYQTVYARPPGSAAAPTAGLHFTPELFARLRERDIRPAFVTLHVGLDTFRPVEEEMLENHQMHSEYAVLRLEVAEQINQAKLEGRRIVAVGTTVVRVLETAARQGTGLAPDEGTCPWRALAPFEGDTDLFIYPGFDFRVVDLMVTNFHLPRSTLLMLVSAFASKELVDRAYAEAVREAYRFYSFGDAMLII
jgi:S-adenosylmethionine:tRNA ribosyltransferase-isomerase